MSSPCPFLNGLLSFNIYYTAEHLDLIRDMRYMHNSFFFFFLYLIRTLFNKRQDACIVMYLYYDVTGDENEDY